MTEKELRTALIGAARSYLGIEEGSAAHQEIVALYNSHTPRARGYKLQLTDDWCAGFIGGMAVKCGLTDIIPMEVSCPKMVELAKTMGIWVEDDSHVPQTGDIILFYWNDSGTGDAAAGANHVGFVDRVEDGKIITVEGNMSDRVGSRTLAVNGRYIRGFVCPDYASMAGFADVPGDAWYAADVDYCKEHGLMQGTDAQRFDPENLVTRAQLAAVAARLHRSLAQ